MSSPGRIMVGEGRARREIAVLMRQGGEPGLFWLGGYRSDMTGSKAGALDAFGARHGLAVTRFDYSGHGQSGGDFLDGTISRWLEEALAVFALTAGPQIVVGSSMGGWLALLLNRALRERGDERIRGLILIAPAVDMTEDLMRATFTRKELKSLEERGLVEQPSEYSDEPYPITRALIEDGRRHLILGERIEVACPVHIVHGEEDPDVPWQHGLKLYQAFSGDDVQFTLVKGGDHRLSTTRDLATLVALAERLAVMSDEAGWQGTP
jgi:pimeloyl-ACP methyl ester carboxylesterase